MPRRRRPIRRPGWSRWASSSRGACAASCWSIWHPVRRCANSRSRPSRSVASGPFDLVQDGTRALAFSPDGKRLFVGTRSSRVMRFDLDNPQNTPAASWKASTVAVEQLAVSPDGKVVYGLCRPQPPVFAWDANTGKPQTPFVPNEKGVAFHSFAVLPSGDLLASDGVRLTHWKADHKVQATLPSPGCFRLAVGSGSMLLMSDGFQLGMYDPTTATLTNSFTDPNLRRAAHEGYIRTIVVHPSGAFIATEAGENDRTVKVWELASGRLIGTVTTPGTGPIALAWSGDGKYLLASAEGYLARWRFAPAESQRFACFAGTSLDSATFVPGGKIARCRSDLERQARTTRRNDGEARGCRLGGRLGQRLTGRYCGRLEWRSRGHREQPWHFAVEAGNPARRCRHSRPRSPGRRDFSPDGQASLGGGRLQDRAKVRHGDDRRGTRAVEQRHSPRW